MSAPMPANRSRRRALVGTAAVAVPAAVVAAVLIPLQASSAVDLPDKTPKQLLEFVAASDVDQLTGTIAQSSDLGIPDLGGLIEGLGPSDAPGSDDGPSPADVEDFLALATGTHTAQVYLDGERARMQVLDSLAERNLYVDAGAGTAWFVDSESHTATRMTVTGSDHGGSQAPTPMPTPGAVLDRALATLDQSTEVTVGTDARVAGRDVYELVLEPRTADTLVGSVRFAVDGENGTVLAASVTARGQADPAFSIEFTSVSYTAPDATALVFEPSPDITVVDEQINLPGHAEFAEKHRRDASATDAPDPTIHGEGWAAVVEVPFGSSIADATDMSEMRLLESVTTPVTGGRVLQTSLITVLFTDDGRLLVGAVPADRLVEAATTGR